MAFSWGEILDEIRDHLNSRGDVFFTDEEIMVQWNHSQLFFARETKFLTKEIDILVSDTINEQFGVPGDFLGVLAIGIKGTDGRLVHLRPLGMAGRDRNSLMDKGYFEIERGVFRLSSQRDLTIDTNTPIDLVFRYYAQPKVLVDETLRDVEVEIPDEYIETVIQGILVQLYLKRRQLEEYRFRKQIFEEMLQRSVKAEGRRLGTKKIQIHR